jgi:hypothetical protein
MVVSVVYHNSVTGSITISDLHRFLGICDEEGFPADAVVKVAIEGWAGRILGSRRFVEITASSTTRLGDERNEPAAVRQALDLPPTASSDEVLVALARRTRRPPAEQLASTPVRELVQLGEDLGYALGIEMEDGELAIAYMRRLVAHVAGTAEWMRERDPRILADLLSLVCVTVTPEQVASWSSEQYDRAERWAGATHLAASDNDDVVVPPRPEFIDAYL